MNPAPVTCRSIAPDGSLITVTATVRPRGGRADVKCSVPCSGPDSPDRPDVHELAQRMQQVVRLARHTEARVDSRDQVVLSLDRVPPPGSRDWELACVLADRIVRGLWTPQRPVVANGWSDAWHLGRVDGHGLRQVPVGVIAGGDGEEGGLPHLGALTGHPDPAAGVSSARAWFPLVSGGAADSLCWVEVSVRPASRAGAALDAGADDKDEELSIAAPGLDAALQARVRAVLAGARHHDGRGSGQWRTTVRFGEARFQGGSFELALVMADRMARGREFLARGRVLASGQSSAWHAGRVDTVDGIGPKCALMAREAAPGDRILVPRAWETQLPPGWRDAVRTRGASVACVDRIGII